jgi:hypothetical protein
VADERKFSRERHAIKLIRREAVEKQLRDVIHTALREQDPTAYPSAVRIIAELSAVIASQLLAQSQANQRAIIMLQDDIADFGTEFVAQLMVEANKDVAMRVKRTSVVAAATPEGVPLADDWAGPVAGPTLIEKHFGIPRSTLYRWQKRNEAIALNTRTSRKPVFPLRQFVDGKPTDGIAELVAIFGDQRLAWKWLVAPSPPFEPGSALDALLDGRMDEVVRHARESVASGLT